MKMIGNAGRSNPNVCNQTGRAGKRHRSTYSARY
jgi:hypothetical protein